MLTLQQINLLTSGLWLSFNLIIESYFFLSTYHFIIHIVKFEPLSSSDRSCNSLKFNFKSLPGGRSPELKYFRSKSIQKSMPINHMTWSIYIYIFNQCPYWIKYLLRYNIFILRNFVITREFHCVVLFCCSNISFISKIIKIIILVFCLFEQSTFKVFVLPK